MRERFLKQANREYGNHAATGPAGGRGVLFVIILPLAILRLGGRLDRVGLAHVHFR